MASAPRVAAGIPVIGCRSHYFAEDKECDAFATGPSLGSAEGWCPAAAPSGERVSLAQIGQWHQQIEWRTRRTRV